MIKSAILFICCETLNSLWLIDFSIVDTGGATTALSSLIMAPSANLNANSNAVTSSNVLPNSVPTTVPHTSPTAERKRKYT